MEAGQKLFEMRLTHEELVQSQSDLLKTAEELDVIERRSFDWKNLRSMEQSPRKTLLERKYEQQKQRATLHAQRQALLLHGLSESQIDDIVKNRKIARFAHGESG